MIQKTIRRCVYGHYHKQYRGCIHKDAETSARLVHRYLAKVSTTKYEYWTQQIEYQRDSYEVQWKNILADARNLNGSLVAVPAYAIASVLLGLFKAHVVPFHWAIVGAIAVDAGTGRNFTAASSTLTYSHTNTGSNLILWNSVVTSTSDDISGVTYAGTQSPTQLGKIQDPSSRWNYLYYLPAPTTGSNTMGISTTDTPDFIFSFSASFTGCKQTGIPDASATQTVTNVIPATGINQNITVVASNCWAVFCGNNDATNCVANSGVLVGTNNAQCLGHSNATIPTGVQNFGFTWTIANSSAALIVASFAPIADVLILSQNPNLLMMGVG